MSKKGHDPSLASHRRMLLVVNVECYVLFAVIHTVRRKTAHILLPWQRRESSRECRLRSEEGNMADV